MGTQARPTWEAAVDATHHDFGLLSADRAASAARGGRARRRVVRRRIVIAIVVLAMGITITVTIDRALERRLGDARREDIAQETELLVEAIDIVFRQVGSRLTAIAGLFRASDEVTLDEFSQFAADLGSIDGMGGYGFAPLVDHDSLDAWVQQMRQDLPEFVVFGLGPDAGVVEAPAAGYHAPLARFWPEQAFGVPPIGLDLMSESLRATSIQEAIASGVTRLTPFLVLLGETDSDGFVAFHPVVTRDGVPLGVLTAPIDLSLLLDAALPDALVEELTWRVVDLTDGHVLEPAAPTDGPEVQGTVTFGGRSWRIEVAHRKGSSHLATGSRAQVLAPGLMASLLAALTVLMIASRLDDRRRRRELEAVIQSKDRFLATVSHELRSPLTGVVGFLEEALMQDEMAPDEHRELLVLAAGQAAEMANIIDDLITAVRSEHAEVRTAPEPIDLADQIESVVRSLPETIAMPRRDDGEPLIVWADAPRVRQILRNLLTNASRYGKPPVQVTIVQDGESVRVDVSDHGPGIPAEKQHLLFRPYEPLHSSPTQPQSLGLGLWISQRLAHRMGGTLTYRPDPLPTFSLTLPCRPPAPGTPPSTPLSAPASARV